jgi:hypothetical protein
MPTFNIELKPGAVERLQQLAARYNGDNGAALTLEQWISLHLRELAVQDELMRAVEELQHQAQLTTQAAFKAERKRLLDSVT